MEHITIGQIARFLELIAGMIASISLITPIILKNVKKHVTNNMNESLEPIYQEIKEIKDSSTDGLKCSLRNDILFIYIGNKERKRISIQEKQAVNYSYELYDKLDGNSFVKDIVEEMNNWEVIN